MQGVILDEFRQYVAARFGFRAWTHALSAAGRPQTHHYELNQVYPDAELGLLATRTAEVTGTPPAAVLEGFGEALVPEMMRLYSYLVDPKWGYGDFLLHMEPILHAALALHTPGAQQTKVHARRLDPESIELTYDSPLRACAAVLGVIRGAAAEYGVEVEVSQEECVLRGDRHCRFDVGIPGGNSSRLA